MYNIVQFIEHCHKSCKLRFKKMLITALIKHCINFDHFFCSGIEKISMLLAIRNHLLYASIEYEYTA